MYLYKMSVNNSVKVKNIVKVKYIVLFTLFATNLIDQPAPEVVIKQGTLTGKINSDGTVLEYLGIPYATVNSTNRFKGPLTPPIWDGVLKATEEIYFCPQKLFHVVLGTEDCLKINVYVPAQRKGPLPVMVYIHGGGFVTGSGRKLVYGPEFLVKHDIILVTFNYRLGPLGFLCLGIEEAPGNAGLRDQLAALRWVNENIAAFGGDAENITIFGESAGGASVSILLATEASAGLFKRAIMQSGSALSSWVINRRPIWTASLLAKELGYNTEDPHELYEIFTKLSYKDIVKAAVDKPLGLHFETKLIYLPCVEKQFPGVEPLLTDLPYNLLINKSLNISIIHGTNSKEGLFFVNFDSESTLQKRNERFLFATDLEFKTEIEAERTASKIKEFYFGKEVISKKNLMNTSEYYTHVFFEVPSMLESAAYLQNAKADIYNYYFNYSGNRNVVKTLLGFYNLPGASHADELFYMFNVRVWPFWINREDQKIINYMTKMWTNFAKFGDPTPPSSVDLPVRWTPSGSDGLKFMYIEDTLRMDSMPNPEAYELWKNIYTKYRRKNV